jgi:cysteine desulfurase
MNTIYLDNHASTQCDPRVVETMMPYLCGSCGNPSSQDNISGRRSRLATENARGQVARLIGAIPHEIMFTSGATESNNLAILGFTGAAHGGMRNRIVTSSIEHKSVLEPCRRLARKGFEIIELPVDRKGRINRDAVVEYINGRTLLVSIQAANNEIGTLQDIPNLSSLAHRHGAAFHCDAAQAAGRIPIDTAKWGIDFLSLSAHKMHGPKGIGALFVRGGVQNRPLLPLFFGGYQEWGLRPGTLNVPAIVGFGEACRIANTAMHNESPGIATLRDRFERSLLSRIPALMINGDPDNRLPNNSSITFPCIAAEKIMKLCDGLALSTGSACNCANAKVSHVLKAIGLSPSKIGCTIRVGWGRFNTVFEPDQAVVSIMKAIGNVLSEKARLSRKAKYARKRNAPYY